MKKHRLASITFILFCLSLLASSTQGCTRLKRSTVIGAGVGPMVQGSGPVVRETRTVEGVNALDLATLGDLTIELGEKEELVIEAQENLLPYFETDVAGRLLRIHTRPNVNLATDESIKFYLTVRGLERIVLSSSGDVRAPDLTAQTFVVNLRSMGSLHMGDLEAQDVQIQIDGSGDLQMGRLVADRLAVDLSSMGSLDLDGGTVGEQTVRLTGSGDYHAAALQSGRAEVHLSSMGKAHVGDVRSDDPEARCEFRVTGSGDLVVGGLDAGRLKIQMTSMGSVEIAGGTVREQEVEIGGSGDYRARALESERADVRLTSMGSATIWVQEHLVAEVGGSGSLRYAGNPAVDQRVIGMGDVEAVAD